MVDVDEQRFLAEDGDEPEDWLPGPGVTAALFGQWRSPREGRANPERLDNPVWHWLVRTRISAYRANEHFAGLDSIKAGPCWCCRRFGQSCTRLPDGRLVRIGGEHEDFYDADFHIYNDVIVRAPDGALAICGYPRAAFPPTDFHSATLFDNRIVVVGCLGYPEQRVPGMTPVFTFDTRTWSVVAVATNGEAPGWIHRHEAVLDGEGSGIVVRGGLLHHAEREPFAENVDDWLLDLASGRWRRLTSRDWQQWSFCRADRRSNHLWQFGSAWWSRDMLARYGDADRQMFDEMVGDLTERVGAAPDLDLFARLWRPVAPHEELPVSEGGDDYKTRRVAVAGVTVRFVNEGSSVRMVVEGELPAATVAALVDDLRRKLAQLERCDYEAMRLA